MTFLELQHMVWTRLGVVEPSWQMQLEVKRALARAHVRIVARHRAQSATADLAFVADDPLVPLPADFLSIRSIRRDGELMRQVDDVEFAKLLAQDEEYGYSGPAVYVMQEPGRIMVFPTPDATDPAGATLEYVQTTTGMSAATDEPDGVPEPWHELVAWTVLAEIGDQATKNYAIQQVGQLEGELASHVAHRAGEDFRVQLRGYPKR